MNGESHVMEVKAKTIGQIDLFQKFIDNQCRTKLTATRLPPELAAHFSAVTPGDEESIRNALILLKSTDLFGINWDMCLTSREALLSRISDIIEYVSGIKYLRVPNSNGKHIPALENDSVVFGKLMINLKYFELGINKIVPMHFLDECISTTYDVFDTEKLRYLIDVEVKTNNLEYSIKSTSYPLPLVNVQNHKYVYNTSIGIVVLMTAVGFLGLIVVVNAISGYPPLEDE